MHSLRQFRGCRGYLFVLCLAEHWTICSLSFISQECKCVIYSFSEMDSKQSLFTLTVSFPPHGIRTDGCQTDDGCQDGDITLFEFCPITCQMCNLGTKTTSCLSKGTLWQRKHKENHAHPLLQQKCWVKIAIFSVLVFLFSVLQ